MKFAVIVFPGSNCDHDAYNALSVNIGVETVYVWHKETELPKDLDCVIIPGGFSYGDYLRCGAIARFSPIMNEVVKFANKGGYVIGICNGFQVLTEAALLPGALLRNVNLSFVCEDSYLKPANYDSAFTSQIPKDKILRIPIAHGEGNYFADADTIKKLEDDNRIAFRYVTKDGAIDPKINPNGSINNIAGILNEKGNVLGMMPHPERYSDIVLGCDDGKMIFNSLINSIK
jgi:phosphoribosylformylglycinamidine synthase